MGADPGGSAKAVARKAGRVTRGGTVARDLLFAKLSLVLLLPSFGCYEPEGGGPQAAPDASSDAAADANGSASDSSPSDGRVPTCSIPTGTTATASASYMGNTPELALDGKLSTMWQAGGFSASIQLKFPSPTTFDRVRIAASATPEGYETYTLVGLKGGSPTTLATKELLVSVAPAKWLAEIPVPAGTWDELRIAVQSPEPTGSWVSISEVDVYESSCPPR